MDPVTEAARRALVSTRGHGNSTVCELAAVREALKPIRDLHRPTPWQNCINACCSGEECKHRSRWCEATDCDNYDWPCATARLVYSDEELTST